MLPALPRIWLMTDDTRGDPAATMTRLPSGAAVIFRHYTARNREALGRELRMRARRLGLVFLVAGDPCLAARLHADGFHAPQRLAHRIASARALLPRGLVTMAAHDTQGLVAAGRHAPDAIILSPAFATASHPGAPPLGPVRFAALAHQAALPVIALGGMNAATFARLKGAGAHGYAGVSFA